MGNVHGPGLCHFFKLYNANEQFIHETGLTLKKPRLVGGLEGEIEREKVKFIDSILDEGLGYVRRTGGSTPHINPAGK